VSVHELRVRTLQLQAPDDALVRRGHLLLEDALRTASFPSAAGGRVLIVRRLALGPFASQASPALLALRMEERIRELTGRAVYADDAAATATAVFFHDEIDPYVRLALRLALRQDTSAWFWRSAVPGWLPSQSREEALRLILHRVLLRPSGVLAAGSLIVTLDRSEVLDDLLAALRWQDGSALLRASGWSLPASSVSHDEAASDAPAAAPLRARPNLDAWTARWGREDARSLWLAATLLVCEKPARLLQPDLIQRARRLLADRQDPGAERPAPSAAAWMRGSPPYPHGRSQGAPDTNPPVVPTAAISDVRSRLVDRQIATSTSPDSEPPRPTAAGGLLFLIPALERLGMGEWLVDHPEVIELSLPLRLLQEVARRVRVPADDSLREALGGDRHPLSGGADRDYNEASAQEHGAAVILPAERWQGLFAGPERVVRRVGGSGDRPRARLLLDATGRLPLAMWRGRAPLRIRERVEGRQLHRVVPALQMSEAEILLHGWMTVLRRWCRRHARLGLHELVRRPGLVRATRTHLDILFPHGHADIRVRRAGLDLDPGWVPWLGSVIQFHYTGGEPPHS
jgi:hypothetical protein